MINDRKSHLLNKDYLKGEFARGTHAEDARHAAPGLLLGSVEDALEDRNDERERLPGAGARPRDHVVALREHHSEDLGQRTERWRRADGHK